MRNSLLSPLPRASLPAQQKNNRLGSGSGFQAPPAATSGREKRRVWGGADNQWGGADNQQQDAGGTSSGRLRHWEF